MSADFSGPLEKKVDESWKSQVEKDRLTQKEKPAEKGPTSSPGRAKAAPETDFALFLSTLSMQVLVALGEVPHPATNQPEENPEQARYLIDILGMLQEKTKGNLTPEEAALLENILYELRMKYVAKVKQ